MFPVIVEALRTPRGAAKPSGALHALSPQELLAAHLRTLRELSGVDPECVQDAAFGCVTQTGEQGGNIGKIASLLAGWSANMSAVTINRYCASGLSAVNWAAQQAMQLDAVTIGGGVEMMSRVPMMADGAPHYTDAALKIVTGFLPPPMDVGPGGDAPWLHSRTMRCVRRALAGKSLLCAGECTHALHVRGHRCRWNFAAPA